jgi:hypothetical protein
MAFLSDFIYFMNKLSTESFEITANGSAKRYFGVLAFGLGDTLAMQWLGEYVEGNKG